MEEKIPISTEYEESINEASLSVDLERGPITSPEAKMYVSTLMVLLMKSSKGADQGRRKEPPHISELQYTKLEVIENDEEPPESVEGITFASKNCSCSSVGNRCHYYIV